MQNTNHQGQMPPTQVPDHRQEEFAEKLRRLEEQNQQLRGQIDFMARSQSGQSQEPEESVFEPQVQEAINKQVKRMLEPMQQEFRQRIGYLMDRNDELSFNLNYGGEKFAKYHSKVEDVRRQAQAEGRYIPREEALRMVYFEETGKKAQPEPQETQKPEPKYDPYFGQMVDPETGLPIKEGQQDPFAEPQAPQQFQQPQHTPQTPQYGQYQPGEVPRGTNPMSNPFGQAPRMPQDQPPQGMAPDRNQPVRREIGLEASDSELAAFENAFGDIEF